MSASLVGSEMCIRDRATSLPGCAPSSAWLSTPTALALPRRECRRQLREGERLWRAVRSGQGLAECHGVA
eukprot:7322379-Alexandrium_andersonii.AAC.1